MAQEQQNSRKTVNLYVDGLCEGSAAGWACILEFGGHSKEMSGFMAGSTQARMEIMAVYCGLGALKEPCNVCLYTKSMSLNRAFNAHGLDIWPQTGWKHKDGTPVGDSDQWMILKLKLRKVSHQIQCVYMPDFRKSPLNQRCAELARGALGEYARINTPRDDEPYE